MSAPLPRYYDLPAAYLNALAHAPNAVLLESSQASSVEHQSLLFIHPVETRSLHDATQHQQFFEELELLVRSGLFVAGFITYELGYTFLGLNNTASLPYPLAWFGVYEQVYKFNHVTNEASTLPRVYADTIGAASVTSANFGLNEHTYVTRIHELQAYLRAGDSYQMNFTDAFNITAHGNLLALYKQLKQKQPVPYGAYLNTDDVQVACLSPELFFKLSNGTLTAQPMKGTLKRGRTLKEDQQQHKALQQDEKNRAENVMIVDLLRNDLGKISQTGSVHVPDLFTTHAYPNLLQMTSTITSTLTPNTPLPTLIQSLFPCGSITGAPKKRSTQLLQQLESRPRGVYTGSIGYISPNKTHGFDAHFNVAIRTLTQPNHTKTIHFGSGSGVTIESNASNEYEECLLKARFLTQPHQPFQLFETLKYKNRYQHLNDHLKRLHTSAQYFNYPLDLTHARTLLQRTATTLTPDTPYRIKLTLHHDGTLTIESTRFTPTQPTTPLQVALSTTRTNSQDPFLFHKTTQRTLYNKASHYATRHNLADILFFNEHNELTEGAISNILIQKNQQLLTPELECGLLPGIKRERLLKQGTYKGLRVREARLTQDDVRTADAIFLCSSLRGVRKVTITAALFFEYDTLPPEEIRKPWEV